MMEDLIDQYGEMLPPQWSMVELDDGNCNYINEYTQESSDMSPFVRYLELAREREEKRLGETQQQKDYNFDDGENGSNLNKVGNKSQATKARKFLEYHCQWTERDSSGKTSIYGLTIRHIPDGKTKIKFDGIDGEWTYTNLEGPYGALSYLDLFIGAKVIIFGRHLTIGSANRYTQEFIEKEAAKLKKKAEFYRSKISSNGTNPIIKSDPPGVVRSIARNKAAGHEDLRRLWKVCNMLGDQMAQLGLSSLIND